MGKVEAYIMTKDAEGEIEELFEGFLPQLPNKGDDIKIGLDDVYEVKQVSWVFSKYREGEFYVDITVDSKKEVKND